MNRIIATAAAALLSAAVVAPASAQTKVAYVADPIHVQHYSVSQVVIPEATWGSNQILLNAGSNLSISFVNERNVPATRVEFAVGNGARTQTVVDNGTFAPGTSITHEFDLTTLDDASAVQVREVTFADGTTWQAES